MKLRTRMIVSFGISTFCVLIVLMLVLAIGTRNALTEKIYSELKHTMEATENIVQSSAENSISSYLKAIAEKSVFICSYYERMALEGLMSREEAIAAAKLILKDPDFGRVGETGYIAALSSTGMATMHPSVEGADVSGHPAIKKAMAQKTGFLEYEWQNKGETSPRKKVSYLLYYEPWDWIIWASSYKEEFSSIINPADIRDHLLSIVIGKTGYPYVLDREGTLIIHPSLEGKDIYNTPDADGKMFVQEMLNDEDGQGFMYYRWQNPDDLAPREKVQLYKRIDAFGWTIAISAYTNEYFDILNTIIRRTVFGILFALLIIFIVTLFISSYFSKAIKQTTMQINELAQRNLTYTINVKGKDEFANISGLCNKMAVELNTSIQHIKQSVRSSRSVSDELSSNATEISATVTEMSAGLDNMRNGVSELSEKLRESDTGLEKIKGTIETVNKLIDEQGVSVSESSSAITEMVASISNIENMTNEKMKITKQVESLVREGEDNIRLTVDSIKDINSYTSSILELISIIKSVAEQTDLLAMNAAIEAAHAGEAGRGFSVVAEEIRKLAETASESTANISSSLSTIAEKIQAASDQSEKTKETFTGIINGIQDVSLGMNETLSGLQEMSAGSNQVSSAMEHLSSLTGKVSAADGEMTKEVEEVFTVLQQIYATMESYLAGISEISTGSNEISNAMQGLSDLSDKNSESIVLLERVIAGFKTE